MVKASLMAADKSVMFQGLTSIAPAPRDCDAPVNSLRINTPAANTVGVLGLPDICPPYLQPVEARMEERGAVSNAVHAAAVCNHELHGHIAHDSWSACYWYGIEMMQSKATSCTWWDLHLQHCKHATLHTVKLVR